MADANPSELLTTWITRQISSQSRDWLEQARQQVQQGDLQKMRIAFSMASRKLGKTDLAIAAADLQLAHRARPRWNPTRWTVDQVARSLLILDLPEQDPIRFGSTLDQFFHAGDVGELVALYQALPILPFPQHHAKRAAEGVRSNIKAVFEAVAHRNPFPAEQFDDAAWNQMILKCLFVDSLLEPVIGLDDRRNPALAQMLVDYAKERRAANRSISPELWRCVGPFADDETLRWLAAILGSGTQVEQQAAALAVAANTTPTAQSLLEKHPNARNAVSQNKWSWSNVADQLATQKV